MGRPLRTAIIILPLSFLAAASFVFGQSLRQTVTATPRPAPLDNRVSSLPAAGIGGTSAGEEVDRDDVLPQETFKEVLRYVKGDYVEKVEDEKKLGFGAVRSMLASLDDTKTRFYDPVQRRQLIDQLNSRYAGIGAVLTVVKQRKGAGPSAIDQRRLAIVAPFPGGPAAKAGLLPGDVITEIDGRWVIAYDPRLELGEDEDDTGAQQAAKDAVNRLAKGIALGKALDLLNGTEDKPVALTVERAGTPHPIKLSVGTAAGSFEPVEFRMLDDRTAYLRITQFNDRAKEQFSKALAGLKAGKLVLDLRDNIGGVITGRQNGALGSALCLIGQLAGPGPAGSVMRRAGKIEPLMTTAELAGRFRLAVLVNGGTSNLAEMAAGTLRERASATVIGSRTFGDSVYQKLVEMHDGAGMTLATGKLLTSRGTDFTGKGVAIDVTAGSGGPRTDDAAVQRAAAG